ncbi:MAG TPA: hypothetical protein VEB20_08365 [Azospirillaceae bacterium]|nr:hypothetical protein [Azospirillaceae bacterium]
MKFAQAGEIIPFTPDDQSALAEGRRVVYQIRVPSVSEEARYERLVAEAGGRQWTLPQLLVTLVEGVKAILPDPDDAERAAILAEIDGIRGRLIEAGERVKVARADWLRATPPDAAALQPMAEALAAWSAAVADPRLLELIEIVSAHHPRLAGMAADNRTWPLVRGAVAARLYVVGWEGLPHACRTGLTGLKEESVRAIPPAHREAIGHFVDGLFGPTEVEAKNSESPSGTVSGETASPAASSTT